MRELEEMKKSFDEFMAKAEQTLVKMKGTTPKEILDKEEKEYLEAVIKPFRCRVKSIKNNHAYESLCFIAIKLTDKFERNMNEALCLPYFEVDTMYKGMELDKEYTLDELGLFKE